MARTGPGSDRRDVSAHQATVDQLEDLQPVGAEVDAGDEAP